MIFVSWCLYIKNFNIPHSTLYPEDTSNCLRLIKAITDIPVSSIRISQEDIVRFRKIL